MTSERDSIRQGHYAAKQLHSGDRLISWSHRRRFERGLALAGDLAGQRILDYGCGDGTFLALLHEGRSAPAAAVGAEIDPRIVADCRRRFAGLPSVRFVDVASLQDAAETESYDAVFCMEVLEHVVDPMPILGDFARLLRPGGRLVISVPIETGPPVVVKQIVRRVAGWRGIGDYPGTSSYGALEMVRSVFAGAQQHIRRPIFPTADGRQFHDHKGFNWRVLRAAVAGRFELVRTAMSPFDWAGAHLSTQAWFVARRRPRGGQ
jgi:SAM-dependent methyltransferase